jgi:hypothetical protein
MGQNNSKQSDTINWNQIKTNEMSSTIPNMNGISIEAKELISRLNLPEISDSNSEFNVNNIFTNEINNELPQNDFDAASPFISSEMYNYLVNKYNTTNTNNTNDTNINMVGGAEKLDEDSVTSATSSSLSSSDLKSSSSETDDKENKQKVNKQKDNKQKDNKQKDNKQKEVSESEPESEPESESDKQEVPKSNNHKGFNKEKNKAKSTKAKSTKAKTTKAKITKSKATKSKKSSYTGTEEYLSYISSSAHTGGSLTQSIANENNYTISTVNTSDINMISE